MKERLYLGISFSLLSALSYSIQTAIVKYSALKISIPILVFFQSFICLILILPLMYKKYGYMFINLQKFSEIKRYHFIRAIFSLGISYFLFYAMMKQSYIDSILLYNTFPTIIPLISFAILSQSIKITSWLFILLSFYGVSLILKPDDTLFTYFAFFALGSALCAALSITMIRKISFKDESLKSLYYYFFISTCIAGIYCLPYLSDQKIELAFIGIYWHFNLYRRTIFLCTIFFDVGCFIR